MRVPNKEDLKQEIAELTRQRDAMAAKLVKLEGDLQAAKRALHLEETRLLAQAGALTVNEMRRRFGLPAWEGARGERYVWTGIVEPGGGTADAPEDAA